MLKNQIYNIVVKQEFRKKIYKKSIKRFFVNFFLFNNYNLIIINGQIPIY